MTGGKGAVLAFGAGKSVGAGADCPVDGKGEANRRGAGGVSCSGATEQPIRLPTIAAINPAVNTRANKRNGILCMALILLEALLALILFVAIVWWTMFSGRSKGELPPVDKNEPTDKAP